MYLLKYFIKIIILRSCPPRHDQPGGWQLHFIAEKGHRIYIFSQEL